MNITLATMGVTQMTHNVRLCKVSGGVVGIFTFKHGDGQQQEALSNVNVPTVELLRTLRALDPQSFARVMRDE